MTRATQSEVPTVAARVQVVREALTDIEGLMLLLAVPEGQNASNVNDDEILAQLRRKLEAASEEVFWLHQLEARLKRVGAPDFNQLEALKAARQAVKAGAAVGRAKEGE